MVEQYAHKIADFRLGSVGQGITVEASEPSEPILNGYRSEIPDVDAGPVWPYPSSQKLPVNNPRRMRVPIRIAQKFSLRVVIHQVRYVNRQFMSASAILIDLYSQSIYGCPGRVFRWKL